MPSPGFPSTSIRTAFAQAKLERNLCQISSTASARLGDSRLCACTLVCLYTHGIGKSKHRLELDFIKYSFSAQLLASPAYRHVLSTPSGCPSCARQGSKRLAVFSVWLVCSVVGRLWQYLTAACRNVVYPSDASYSQAIQAFNTR